MCNFKEQEIKAFQPKPSLVPPAEPAAVVKPEIPPKSTINDVEDQADSSESDKRLTKRRFIVTELVDTEKTYLSELKRCYAAFMGDNLISFDQVNKLAVCCIFSSDFFC